MNDCQKNPSPSNLLAAIVEHLGLVLIAVFVVFIFA
jgi:hypothetical protein